MFNGLALRRIYIYILCVPLIPMYAGGRLLRARRVVFVCRARAVRADISIKPLAGCRAVAIKQMLTPRPRRLGLLSLRVSRTPSAPRHHLSHGVFSRTRITFCNSAYSTPSHRPILTGSAASKPNDRPEVSTCSLNDEGFA